MGRVLSKGIRHLVSCAAASLLPALPAAAVAIGSSYVPIAASDGAVVPGEWNSSVTAGKAYADENNVPMLAVYGSATCSHCQQLQTACNTDEFKEWAESKKIVMVFGHDTAAKRFCKPPDSNLLPFVCVYWNRGNGPATEARFTGVIGSMPSKDGSTLAAQLVNSCEMYIGAYPQMTGFEYLAFTNAYACARLEAEAGATKYVDVPLARDAFMKGSGSTNRFTAAFHGSNIVDKTVVWNADHVSMSVRVDIPSSSSAGDEIDVSLRTIDGTERGSAKIFIVPERENSPKNPLFVGERTKDSLQYGEWTMDLDVAMAKYKAEADSKLLALVGGALWCPDCVMADLYLLDRPEFKAWAVENKVILVDIDIPNLPNATNSPSLLTRIVSRTSDGYVTARDTRAADENERYQSGAGYLSRHMVSDEAAAAVAARNAALVGANRANGGWNDPDRANQSRTGVPVFFALKRDGTVAGCLDAFASTAPREFKPAYLDRLDELLSSADGEGYIADDSWQTTAETFDGGAAGVSGTLGALDLRDTFAIDAVASGAAMQNVTVSGTDAAATVTVNLISVSGSSAKIAATATGVLADGVEVSCVMTPAESYYVQVAGAASGTLAIDSAARGAKVAYTVRGVREAIANPYANDWTATTARSILPLYAEGGSKLGGYMELQLKKNKKVGVKLYGVKGRLASLAGTWSEDISADGTATAVLRKKDWTVAMEMTAEGEVSATASDGAVAIAGGGAVMADYGDWSGNYAVALPLAPEASGRCMGAAYMTLSMGTDKTSRTRGKVKYSVVLPNGRKLNGISGVSGLDANFGVVPVAKTSGKDSFCAAIRLRRNAATAATRRAAVSVEGVKATWNGSDGAGEFDVRGSLISKTDSLIDASGVERVAFSVDTSSIGSSGKYGQFLSALYDNGAMTVTDKTIAAAEKAKGFSFRLNRKTGVFSGRTTLAFTDREKIAAKFSGVILPHWFSDCECQEEDDDAVPMAFMPFGAGQCIFNDYDGAARVKRSIPAVLKSANASVE